MLTDKFEVMSEDGRRWIVLENTRMIDVSTMCGHARIPGIKDLRTRDGYHVTPGEQKGQFIILGYEFGNDGISVTRC